MRVLHLLNDVTDRGNGIVNTAVDLAIEQSRQGLEVAVASAGGAYEPLLTQAGVRHFTLDQPRSPFEFPRALRALLAHIRRFQPEIVHAHMRTGLVLGWLAQRMLRFGRVRRFALVGHVHNVHDRESILMGLADRVIAVSESVAESMERQLVPRRKIRVVLNRTLGSSRVPPLTAVRAANLERPAIVTVGGMNMRKGIQELLSAFGRIGAECANAHLYLVGDGPDRAQFEEQARQTRFSERIHFEGYQAVPQAYMLSADVFVLASRRESFGLVLIEARQAGCAIVATAVDGIAEALDGGQAGVLVPARNEAQLADAIGRLLSDDAERAQWQKKAREGIARFTVDRMATETLSVYDELVTVRPSRSMASAGQRYPAGGPSE